jgi:hypothetical protein
MTQEAWRMFKVGNGFWKGSRILLNSLRETKDSDLHIPIFIDQAFAGEIYLKCLLLIQTGKYPKGHDLKFLFDQLPATEKSAVDEIYKNEFKNSILYRHLMTRKVVSKLSSVLARAGKTYVNMRYSFQSTAKPLGPTVGLPEFIEAVRKRLLVIEPELQKLE